MSEFIYDTRTGALPESTQNVRPHLTNSAVPIAGVDMSRSKHCIRVVHKIGFVDVARALDGSKLLHREGTALYSFLWLNGGMLEISTICQPTNIF